MSVSLKCNDFINFTFAALPEATTRLRDTTATLSDAQRMPPKTHVYARELVSIDDESALSALASTTIAQDDALCRASGRAGAEQTLRVTSWNVQFLPGIWRGCGGRPKDMVARALRIAENLITVARTNAAVDILCVQEAFHEPSRRALIEAMRSHYPYVYAPNAKSGLITFSKTSHVCNHFSPLPACGIEKMAFTKGVSTTFLRLASSDERRTAAVAVAIVLNTHLQSDYWSNGADTRLKQLRHIKSVMQRALRECAGNSYRVERILLCGDLNIAAEGDEYVTLMQDVFPAAVDLTAPPMRPENRSDRKTFPVARWRHYVLPCRGASRYIDLEPNRQLDYVLDLTPMIRQGVPPVHRHVDSAYVHHALCRDAHGLALSDHYPVVALSSTFHVHGHDYTL